MNFTQRLAIALLFAVIGFPAFAQDHWVATWGAGAVKCSGEDISAGGVTYRNIAYISLGGKQVRLTLSNRFGIEPLKIGGVTVARSAGSGSLDSGSVRDVTFKGKAALVIAPGATVISDPVDIDVAPLSNLAVSIFLPAEKVSYYTGHPISHQTNYRAIGNDLGTSTMSAAAKFTPWRILTAIDVMAPAADAAIVAFGDSITDGQGSTTNANDRWPNLLAARLQANPKYAGFAVVDEGIGGNRILHAGGAPDARAGEQQSGLTRWSYDALDRSGVKYIILFEGINDIGHSSMIKAGLAKRRQEVSPEKPITASDLIHAMTQMIDEAHARGIKVIGATLTPYGGAEYERLDGEKIHSQINNFIRHGGKFDGVIDFAKAVRDPAHPEALLPAYDFRHRHLHLNDAGYEAMANAINLKLFAEPGH